MLIAPIVPTLCTVCFCFFVPPPPPPPILGFLSYPRFPRPIDLFINLETNQLHKNLLQIRVKNSKKSWKWVRIFTLFIIVNPLVFSGSFCAGCSELFHHVCSLVSSQHTLRAESVCLSLPLYDAQFSAHSATSVDYVHCTGMGDQILQWRMLSLVKF